MDAIGEFESFFQKILDNIFKMEYIDINLYTPALEAIIRHPVQDWKSSKM